MNILPNIPINEESDIIDEDSLLTVEDLAKLQLPIGKYTVFQFSFLIVVVNQHLLFPLSLTVIIDKESNFTSVGDCEVGKARKACKNCTCGRAEAEAEEGKLQKLDLTRDQINNPRSACGSVSTICKNQV